jgi:AcrR family transcriptional regulator
MHTFGWDFEVTTEPHGAERIWGGTTLANRRAARREQLLEAGLDLLGGEGPPAVAVRAVCRRAHLTERYFYESFRDRDALVTAIYERVSAEARETLESAARAEGSGADRARTAIESTVGVLLDDPRKGRALLLAPLTERVLAGRGLEFAQFLATLIRQQLSPGVSREDGQLIAVGLLGSLSSLFAAYLQGALTVDRDEFVAHCVRLLLTVDRLQDPRQLAVPAESEG